jgi:hypothetical protein
MDYFWCPFQDDGCEDDDDRSSSDWCFGPGVDGAKALAARRGPVPALRIVLALCSTRGIRST